MMGRDKVEMPCPKGGYELWGLPAVRLVLGSCSAWCCSLVPLRCCVSVWGFGSLQRLVLTSGSQGIYSSEWKSGMILLPL